MKKELRDWLLVTAWALVLFSAVPFARRIQEAVAAAGGDRPVFTWITIAGILIGAAAMPFYARHQRLRTSPGRIAALAAVTAVFIASVSRLKGAPVEAFHFVEYAVLGFLLFRAFSRRVQDPMVYLCALFAGAFIGTLDEVLQWMTPGRVWDLRDVGFNTWAVALVQVAIAAGIRPPAIGARVRASSLRLACRLCLALLLLLILCLANSPPRVEWMAANLPGMSFLANEDHIMTEYGYRHRVPGIGAFTSRLTLEELERENRAREAEGSREIDRWQRNDQYMEFLRRFRTGVDPFLNEARVHLFVRDHNVGILWPKRHNAPINPLLSPDEVRLRATTAYRENQIVETFFPSQLNQSPYRLNPRMLAVLKEHVRWDFPYESPVASAAITLVSEWQLRIILLALCALVILVDLASMRRDAG